MSCGCYEISLQGEQYCQGCMPDEYSWLVSVDSKPDPFLMDRNHAYITPDNTVFVLDHTRSKAVPIGGGGGGIDLSIYALNSDLENKVRDLLAEIAKVKSEIKVYTAGDNIEITPDNVIHNTYTYDDRIVQERLFALENEADNDKQTLSFNNTSRQLTISNGNSVTIPDTRYRGRQNIIIEGNTIIAKEYVEYTSSLHQLCSPLQPLSAVTYVKQGLEGDTVRKFNTANGDAWLQMGIYYIKQSDMAQALMWPQSIVEEYLQVIDDVKASDDDPNTPYTPKTIRGNTRLTYVDRPDVFVERTGTHYDLYLYRLNNNEYEFKYEFIPKVEGVNVRTMAGYIKDIRDKTTYPETLNYSVTGGRNYSITKDQLYSQIGRMRGLYRTWLTHYVYIDPRFATTNKPK